MKPSTRNRALRLSWSDANAKLGGHSIVSFGLPAGESKGGFNTCPGKGICAGYCFARQGFYVFPWVAKAREKNLAATMRPTFEAKLIRDLYALARPKRKSTRGRAPLPFTLVRIHDSGDFYSSHYMRMWYSAIRQFPEIRFYAYTKVFHEFGQVIWAEKPDNLRLIQSAGSIHDEFIRPEHPHSRVFLSHEDRVRAGYADGASNDEIAALGDELKIGLVFHGSNRPLTPAQRRALSIDDASMLASKHAHNRTGWKDAAALRVIS